MAGAHNITFLNLQVKELNLEEGGAFTVSSADTILAAL
jgi:hypothetical protein